MTKDIHYSEGLEKVVLGAILLEPTAFGRVYGIMEKEVFYFAHHQVIFQHFSEMWTDNLPIDIYTATNFIVKKGIHNFNGDNVSFVMAGLIRDICSTANLEYHSIILKQMYIDREMIRITSGGTDGKDGLQVMNELQDKIQKLREVKSSDDFKEIGEVLISLYQHMDKVKDQSLAGITLGFKELDRLTGGMENGGVYIVAARPSVGKSAFMGQMVLAAANENKKVGIISLEMEDKKIAARMASIVSDVEFWRINRNRMYDNEQAEQFYESMNRKMKDLPILISDKTGVNMSDIKSKVSRLKSRSQIDILFIDYLGLIDTEGKNRNQNREQEVSQMSRGIKLMAMQYEIPVVLLCQLNRLSEQGHEKKPKLHNLRESGSLEQDADGVIFIHRDFMSGIKINSNGSSTEGEADIIVAKWRNGEIADIKVGFDGPKMRFYELGAEPVRSSGNWKPVIDAPF